MSLLLSRLRALVLGLIFGLSFVVLSGQAALAASFLDPGLRDVPPEEKVVVASPQPVQILFQFQTDGAANGRATDALKKQVLEIVRTSGLFSEVSELPVANGAVISVTINNVVEKDAAAKGAVTGLTFGLKGTLVTDRYVCTVEYISGPDAAKITRVTNHAIHSTIGLKDAPPGGIKAKNLLDAVTTMTRQIVSNALNQVAGDPAFAQVATAPVAPTEPVEPTEPVAPTESVAPVTPEEPATPAEATTAAPAR